MLIGNELGADEAAPELCAQVRSVKTAENAVPVGIVALRAKEKVAGLLQLLAGFRDAAARGRGVDAIGDMQHFFVQQVGFGIFAEESAPGSAAEEGEHLVTRGEFLEDLVVALADTRG